MASMQILVEKNVPCTLRDGTILYADVYRPNDGNQYPVLLTRLPYNKNERYYSHRYLDTHRLVENGYVVIIQDVRGRFSSEGDFYPFKHEGNDGYDAVEWAAGLPYSDGNVGMFGLSYYGYTQLLAAAENPPHLKAIFPAQTLSDIRDGGFFRNGVYELGQNISWALESIAGDELKRKYVNLAEYEEKMRELAEYIDTVEDWYTAVPLREWPPLKNLDILSYFFEMAEWKPDDDAWKQVSLTEEKLKKINVPAYHLAGWYDCFLGPSIANFVKLKQSSNQTQMLMIGPWAHGNFGFSIGERRFGLHASENWINYKEDLTNLHLRWFDQWLKGVDTGLLSEKPVKIFVMGENVWREEEVWPLPDTTHIPYYFHSEGVANTRFGNGQLSTEPPKSEPFDQFIFNPKYPVPTTGGGTLLHTGALTGPADQRAVEEREDVLVFTSQVLEDELEVTGPIKVVLYAKTDGVDTDFTAKLVDVLPNGTAYNLTDGIVRASDVYKRIGNEVKAYEIDLWATSNVFMPGHRIRVEVSSSNFPRFDVNMNNGGTMLTDLESRPAMQIIYHEEDYPSHIILPVIRRK
ncbi:CocE/NonD family hydrolase [Neobacillus rhizophilus]|uniref:CocE/NonD family hydrolase n=1 Tax=Neobacillus rhizophilus TaxID=2833579 RepID=A0A942YY33_9BACI|nr:CocE/NonD family hydrolase [Neobacillus rhizophilus]MBS4216659.1 CocE/NonD family hydrolase [Neobacillus rhizophilus]